MTEKKKNFFEITSVSELREVVDNTSDLVVIDFYATWCVPCVALLGNLMDIVNQNLVEGVTVVKANVDNFTDYVQQNGIRGVPTLVGYKSGVIVDRRVGAAKKSEVLDWIQQLNEKTKV